MRGEAPKYSFNSSYSLMDMEESLNLSKEDHQRENTEESMLESSSALSDNLHVTTSTNESDVEPMDINNKTVTDSDNISNCSSPSNDTKYFCPICDITLTSQHEFTIHIRSHNNENEIINDKGFTCRICAKILSSSSSLDRHMLVHSGERPFSCKICAVTFTTNGNMHRHMRTHSHNKGSENYESDGSTDSNNSMNSNNKLRKRRLEFNNNKLVDNKRKSDCFTNEDDNTYSPRKNKHINNNNNINENLTQKIRCPVCGREDFSSINVLEMHLEDNHPDFEVKCTICNVNFKNNRALNLHRYMVHYSEPINNVNNKNLRNSVVGFKDLTFVDFSSNKFPQIAAYACEKSLHKPITGQKFICNNCSLAFPCSSALQIHEKSCLKADSFNDSDNQSNSQRKSECSEEDIRREDFFAHLDLQNKSAPTSPSHNEEGVTKVQERSVETKAPIDSKDLADIQSILTMTSNLASNGSLLQHLRPKPSPDILQIPQDLPQRNNEHQEEESQDVFAAEFRKMKLRGEFPCRLCTAVFPNLRALKGHNRAHLTGTGNTGPYRCNMCPHSSVDKAALIRHMRTHNGDRPYECSLCNYAFTTKANCERHLRNRHAKVTREEVKKAIIYHPSEDPTNDDNKLNSTRDELKRSFLNSSNEEDHVQDRINSSTPKESRMVPELGLLMAKDIGINISPTMVPKDISMNLSIPKEHSPLLQVKKELGILKEKRMPKEDVLKQSPYNILREKMEETFNSKNHYKSIDGLKQIPEYEIPSDEEIHSPRNNYSNYDDYSKTTEHPIDLSMDVLDLSKKKSSPEVKKDEPVDCTKKTLESNIANPAAHLLLAQQLLKHPFYANQFSQFYQNPAVFPGLQNLPMPLNPYIFTPPFLNSAAAQEMKERMLRLQLQSGGQIISDQFSGLPTDRLQSYQQSIQEMKYSSKLEADEIKPPLHINTHLGESMGKLHSPKPQQKTPEIHQSPNSVKMVIKNGVLMPKQKQRRYRTERPFSCEHCSARFTLRSNMERHIKQQHPQFWSQRQRSGISSAGRKPAGSVTPSPLPTQAKPPFYDLNIPNYDMHIPKMSDNLVNDTKDQDSNIISQHVKYAILAQQLKAKDFYNEQNYPSPTKEKLDEDEDALVIDEENENSSKMETKDIDNKFSEELKQKCLEEKLLELRKMRQNEIKNEKNTKSGDSVKISKPEEGQDLVPVSRLLDNAVGAQLPFREYFRREGEYNEGEGVSEEDEEGLVASGSTSEGNGSSGDEHNKSENENITTSEAVKKKSAYSLAPNRVSCPYCNRKFPWTSSLRRHILTHTGQKPFKCSHCPLLFTTKSNCDRHLLRKHGNAHFQNTDTANSANNKSQNYMMRNVPERPYKCSSCPSSTFSTLSNLNKHMSCKHTADIQKSEDRRAQSSEYESHGSSEDERLGKSFDGNKSPNNNKDWENQISHSKSHVPEQTTNQNSDLPFKCHLCEGSFAERQEALDHIKDIHVSEFELLMSKGALDQNVSEEINQNHETEEDDHLRGKFPDYANRKVMCAFCMRRFWSAEDLRRHMRTHTGERPFSCDVCRRRFTLKHSMLRHRKKHNNLNPLEENIMVSGDEEINPNQVLYDRFAKLNNNNNLENKNTEKSGEEDSEGTEGNDLIGNLLGIRDKSIIDQALVSSADDAAKILGVKNGQD